MKKAVVLYSEYSPIIDAIKHKLKDYQIDCVTSLNDNQKYDLVILCGFKGEYNGNAICCHHSLLPSFDCEEPVKEAMLAGVKVTGITIYFTNPKKIIAQYPVFINNNTHFDELKQELIYLEQVIFPLVIEKILKNEPFEMHTLMNKSCSNHCGGCSGCNH